VAAAGAEKALFKTGLAAMAALMIGWCAGASAAPMIIESVRAGTVEDLDGNGTPDRSFQSSIVVRDAVTWENRGVVEFDLNGIRSAIAGGATFNSVHLELTSYGIDAFTDSFLLHVFGYTGNGLFDHADFNAGSFLLGQTLDNDVVVASIDVTDHILDFLDGSDRYTGFSLRGGNPGFQFGFYQGRSGPPGVAPRLVFDYVAPVPEPASLALFGFGLAAFAATRRRTRH